MTSRLNAFPPSQAGMGRWRRFFFSKRSSQILPFCIGAGVQQISRVELIPHCIITVYKEGIIWHVSAIYFTVLAAVVHTNEHGWVLFSPPCEMKAETPAVNGFPKGSGDAPGAARMPGASNPAGVWGCKHRAEKAAGLPCKANSISRVFIQQQEETLPTLIYIFFS